MTDQLKASVLETMDALRLGRIERMGGVNRWMRCGASDEWCHAAAEDEEVAVRVTLLLLLAEYPDGFSLSDDQIDRAVEAVRVLAAMETCRRAGLLEYHDSEASILSPQDSTLSIEFTALGRDIPSGAAELGRWLQAHAPK